ncbi:MAG TPA: DUF1036 domain-containing protein [Rhizomicrobium sp.]|nr:DUF1036 domain-containing protein [Rhizomicrobium sp.]
MRRTALFLAAILACATASLALVSPAWAAFNVCNRSSLAARVAMGRFDGTSWSSQGWWTVKARTCARLLNGPLQGRFYYLYATDGAAGTWEGKTHFCVAPEKRFQAVGRGNCARRGFDRRGFFEVDTGKKSDWTQSLSN